MDSDKFYTFLKNNKKIKKIETSLPNGILKLRFSFKTNSVVNIEGLNADCELTITEGQNSTVMSFRCLSKVCGKLPVNADNILNQSIRKLMKETGFLKNIKLLRFLNGMKFSITNEKPLHSFAIDIPHLKQDRISDAVIRDELKKKYNLQSTDIDYLKSLIPTKLYFLYHLDLNSIIEIDKGILTENSKELLELNYRY